MGGKGPIIGVLGLGLVASLCAAVLMAAMRSDGSDADAEPARAEVVVVASDLPPMTRIEQSRLDVKTVDLGEMPEGGFSDPVQILGRVVKVPVVAGQPITEAVLLSDEGGAQLASSLPEGYRAVSIELPGSSAMRGLLYPGCKVDVIVAFSHRPGSRASSGPVSRTLLQNVSVLAVEDKTVFDVEKENADGDAEEAPARPSRRNTRTLMVTLMVDPQQARELQSSRDSGELSLSLRNPLDSSITDDPVEQALQDAEAAQAAGQQIRPGATGDPANEPWRTLVIRGGKSEVQTFNEPAEDGDAGDPEDEPDDRLADVPTDPEIDE